MPRRSRPLRSLLVVERAALPHVAVLALAGLGAVVSVVALAVPGLLPVDRTAAAFLLAACFAGTADPAPTAPATLAAAALCILSPSLFGLVLGFGLACVLVARPVFGIVPVLAAAALLGSGSVNVVRAHPPGVGTAVAVLVLAFVGAAPLLAGRAPALAVAALYVLARTLELCGPGVPGWWGLVLMPAGTVLAAFGAWQAVAVAETVPSVGQRLFTAGLGLALAALGAEAAARGSDLTDLAATAASGLAMAVVATAASLAAAALAGRAIAAGAGTVRLSHLGGLAGAMPRASVCLAVAAASFAFLPPSWGFAGLWLMGQAVLGLPRTGTAGAVVTVSAAGAGLALGCALAAVLRLGATACLGRPRTPRASAATDADGLRGMLPLLAALGLGAAGLPAGPAGSLLAGPAAVTVPWLTPGLFVLLAAVVVPSVLLARPHRRVEAWNDGRDPPPPWLPFGDPAEQWGAASFAALFRLPPVVAAGRVRWPVRPNRAAPAVLFAVLLLLALAAVRS